MYFFRKYFVLILVICVGLVIFASLIPYFMSNNMTGEVSSSEIQTSEIPFTHEANLSIFNKKGELISPFEVELAQNEQETALGLMYRKSMAQNRGMLFIFPQEEMRYFWMKNTYIPLDIIYINAEHKIVSISKNAQPLSEISQPSEAPARYVLEVNAGVCDQLGIKEGDTITYEILQQ